MPAWWRPAQGTGKTTLLRALLNVLHNAATQEYFESVLNSLDGRSGGASAAGGTGGAAADDPIGKICASISRSAAAQYGHEIVRHGRILVCAQSNAALDELIARLLRLQVRCRRPVLASSASHRLPPCPMPSWPLPCRRPCATGPPGRRVPSAPPIRIALPLRWSPSDVDVELAALLPWQFVDEFGQRYQADMVRLGSQPGDAVRAVTLKARVDSLASSATGLRFSAGAIAATGGSAAEATPRSRAEQAAHVSKLTAKRAKRVEEQLGLARKRAQHRQMLDKKLLPRLNAAKAEGVPPDDRRVVDLTEHCRSSSAAQLQMAQRIVALQTEIDGLDTELHSMEALDRFFRTAAADGAGGRSGGEGALSLSSREIRQLEGEVLDRAHIVFCTLSGAGEAARLGEVRGGFATAIFDEAAQAAELATLIPLQFGARRVVLVGDPQQLPATILSLDAKRRGYDTSLFERLQRGGYPCHMLRTQYRMHPSIRAFPSAHFYHNRLVDGDRPLRAARVPPGAVDGAPAFLAALPTLPHAAGAPRGGSSSGLASRPLPVELRLAPYLFCNLTDGAVQRSESTHSLRNEREARFVARLLLGLLHAADEARLCEATASEASRLAALADAREGSEPPPMPVLGSGCGAGPSQRCALGGICGRVAILTPYKEQCRTLEAELNAVFGSRTCWEHAVEVASVDTYQGKEKDVILYSTVRSGRGGIGFVNDLRRLNVALTRARHAL